MKKQPRNIFLVICLATSIVFSDGFSAYENYVYDSNDFATGVVAYNSGTGIVRDWLSDQLFNNPLNALGRPTIDTTGEDLYVPEEQPCPVNPVYSPFRSFELVCLGEQGSIVLQFNHSVEDNQNNPYEVDFIVFGNAQQKLGNNQVWTNGDPAMTTVGTGGFYEPGIVSVSQDGIVWYSFTSDANFMSGDSNFIKLPAGANDGPFCDSFAPTLGRVYNPNSPDSSLGSWNLWWSEPTNPTLPIDPLLTFTSFDGNTVAKICQTYGSSAGGTGYDIGRLDIPVDGNTGLKWFRYVRVDDKPSPVVATAEIDAVSDVSACGDYKHPFPAGDLNFDCKVNFEDFAVLSGNWLECTWNCN